LLAAATALIAERRSSSATFAEIAARAGRSHGHPHYLFGSKVKMLEALVHDLAERVETHVLAPAVGDATGLDALLAAVRAALANLRHPNEPTRALWVLVGEAMGGSPDLRPALAAYHEAVLRRVRTMIADGIAAGDVRPDADPDAQAVVVLATIRGVGFIAVTNPDLVDTDAMAEAVVAGVERSLRA
jgi:AcrR family transcriptional regulator